ncbi:hypothetical protein L7F22_056806 [Adiantum nelumboides]|nr:hypothetical protein [Adiantum nelumboides]
MAHSYPITLGEQAMGFNNSFKILQAFIIASTATEEEMRHWYKDRIVWTDKELNLRLMRKGILTRIYAPMVIIQGLREANVFGKALSAEIFGKEELDVSVKRSPVETGSVVHQNSFSVMKETVNITGDVEPTTRRLLHVDEHVEMAVPPLPLPSLDLINREGF